MYLIHVLSLEQLISTFGDPSEDIVGQALEGALEILETTNISVDCQNVYGFTPLFLASEREHLTIVRLLVARGADVDRVSSEGYTALIYAVRAGLLDTVKTLLDIGAGLWGDVRVGAPGCGLP